MQKWSKASRLRPALIPRPKQMDAGYSGKPLADKLGLKPGMRINFANAPEEYAAQFKLPALKRPARNIGLAQVFVRSRAELEEQMRMLLPLLDRDGVLWVSWPKKSAVKKLGLNSDLSEDVIREVALPLGLVDVKVCAVDETWSGLKLVIRKELR